MSANGFLIETLTRHQIFLQRYGSGVVNDLEPILEAMSRDIRARLLAGPTEFQFLRLSRLLAEVDEVIQAAGTRYGEQLVLNLEEFTQYEADFLSRAMQEVVNVEMSAPPPQQLAAAVTQSAARILSGDEVVSVTVPDLVRQFTASKSRQVTQMIRAGYIEGAPLQEIVRRVTDVTDKAARRQAGAVVRTAVNHMGTQARQETYRQNMDVLEGLMRVATLDGRTSFQCMANDRREYPLNTTDLPPYHWACRTVMVGKVKDEFSLFTKGYDRASKDGPVDARTTYNSFLKRQSKDFQNEVLGPERAQLFRDGLSVDKFVDDVGRTLTLEELRQREGLTLQQ